jgi:hypothetical protein
VTTSCVAASRCAVTSARMPVSINPPQAMIMAAPKVSATTVAANPPARYRRVHSAIPYIPHAPGPVPG